VVIPARAPYAWSSRQAALDKRHAAETEVSARAALGTRPPPIDEEEAGMRDAHIGGISLGGILVIVGIVLAILLGHWWIGLIIALIGLLFFGGFARGKWY
jgi:hypothetical protein